MKYGIGHLSVVPCRADAADSSEQVTQLLFGETIKVYEKKRSWYRVKTDHDSYECWIDENQFKFITQREFEQLSLQKPFVVSDLVEVLTKQDGTELMTVLMGSNLPNIENKLVDVKEAVWKFEGNSLDSNEVHEKKKLTENAFMLLNAPYQWGGRSPFGIDCSGFVQLVYKLNGIYLPRDASRQASMGQPLSFIEEAEEGDLAFFDNDEGNITHVGIILSNNRIIHASGKVRIDKLDHQGIYNQEKRDYSHRLRLISSIY